MSRVRGRRRTELEHLAKQAYVRELKRRGYTDIRITKTPTDIEAWRDGTRWRFEVKATESTRTCFGAATLTEWVAALEDPAHFRFVIAQKRSDYDFGFDEYTPDEFMASNSFELKMYFNVRVGCCDTRPRKRKLAAQVTADAIRALSKLLDSLRPEVSQCGTVG